MREFDNSSSVGSGPLLIVEIPDNVMFPFILFLEAKKNKVVLSVCCSVAAKTLLGYRHSGFELKSPEKAT